MKSKKVMPDPDDEAADLGPRSIYDTDPPEDDELWFLPPEDEESQDAFLPPGPRVDQRLLFDPRGLACSTVGNCHPNLLNWR